MLPELVRFARKHVRLAVIELLRGDDHLDIMTRMQVAEDSLDSLDRKTEYQGSRLAEWIDCGHHSAEYRQDAE